MDDFARVKSNADLEQYAKRHLAYRGKGKYNCPICGSGTGPDASPAFSVKGDTWTCFSASCGKSGDIFDLAGIINHTEDKREQLQLVADWAGIALEGNQQPRRPAPASKPKPQPVKDYSQGIAGEAARLKEWQANIEAPEAVAYLEGRGFTLQQAKAWGIGYDAAGKRIVIPYPSSGYYHIDRDVTGAAAAKYRKPRAEEVGQEPPFNTAAIEGDLLYIVEGPFDALAVEACGHHAMATCGSGSRAVEGYLVSHEYRGAVIVALDNEEDSKGPKHQREMVDSLRAAGIWATGAVYPAGWPKDFGEAYQASESKLRAFLGESAAAAMESKHQEEEEAYNRAMKSLRVFSPRDLAMGVCLEEQSREPIPTGFPKLDGYLGDGLQQGLYIMGAVSSMGKTTLALQIADTIAAGGYPVLFVTIEQTARELVAKSIARVAAGYHYDACESDPITAQDINNRRRRREWGDGKTEALVLAAEAYSDQVAGNLRIMEADGQPSVADIAAAAQRMAEHMGKAPAVFIDYLQLLRAENERDSDKQTVDKNVGALRRLAGRLKAPVFAISSLNRASYNGAISLESFKESGAVEYGSDVLLGLQPAGIGNMAQSEAGDRIDSMKTKRIREVELSILKNRSGSITGRKDAIPFRFDAVTNAFEER